MLSFEWLRTFKTIYEKGSMTAAADALLISQPGVSLHLSSLENHVGYQLFERRPRLLIPTEKGKLLYNAIVDPISRLEEVEKRSQKTNQEDRPSITVGMCFETFQLSLEKHVPSLPCDLILEFGEYRSLLEKLESRVIDLVVTPQKFENSNLCYEGFAEEHIVLVAGKGLDIGCFSELLKEDTHGKLERWLKEQMWYGVAGDNEHFHRFWKSNFGTTPDFRPNFIVPNLHSIIRNLTQAAGLAIIPDFLCRSEVDKGDLKILWKGFNPLTNTLHFARHKKCQYPELLDLLENKIRSEIG